MSRTALTATQHAALVAATTALAAVGLTIAQAAHLRLAADLCDTWRGLGDAWGEGCYDAPDDATPLAMAERWAEQGDTWDASDLTEGAAALLAD